MADTTIGQFFVKLGLNVDQTKWKDGSEKIRRLQVSMGALRLKLLAAGSAFLYFEKKVADMSRSIQNQPLLLQTSLKNLQAMRLAADEAGVSFNTLTGVISNLQQQLVKIRTGMSGVPMGMQKGLAEISRYSGINLSPKNFKTGGNFFKAIIAAVGKMNTGQGTAANDRVKQAALGFLGMGNLFPMVRNGMSTINKATSQLGKAGLFYTPKEIQESKQLMQQMGLLGDEFRILSVKMGVYFEPIIKSLTDNISHFIQNKNAMEGLKDIGVVLETVGKSATYAVTGLEKLAGAINTIVQDTRFIAHVTGVSAASGFVSKATTAVENKAKDYWYDFQKFSNWMTGGRAFENPMPPSQEKHVHIHHTQTGLTTSHITGNVR